jgi:NADH:ubiquinone oxidoreductase subunit 5 (subunit L)/multisubunit Na+/H+ antiporter MnhA subunit
MAEQNTVLLLILALPFAGALVTKVFKQKYALRAGFFILLIQMFLSAYLLKTVSAQKEVSFRVSETLFRCDLLGIVFLLTSVLMGVLIYLFSIGYFTGEQPQEQGKFAFWGLVFVGSMMGVILSDSLISLYLFWELAGLCSWRLIGFYRKDDHLFKADKAFLITSAGAGFMLLGFAYIYKFTGSLSLSIMSNSSVPPFVFALFFLGVITKSASFPFHTWLPDASVAPTPVTAFLHAAVLVKIGVYALARVFGATLYVSGSVMWAGWLALFSSFAAGIIAMRENDIKKILAYSTVSQLGFMLAGLMMFNAIAVRGVLIFYVAHALGKGCLFLCAGITERVFGTRDIREMGGLMKKAPVLTYAFFFSMLSVIGIPPLPGFFGKLEAITGMLVNKNVFFAFTAITTSVLTLLYLFRIFKYVFMGDYKETSFDKTGFRSMTASVVILTSISLIVGILLVT